MHDADAVGLQYCTLARSFLGSLPYAPHFPYAPDLPKAPPKLSSCTKTLRHQELLHRPELLTH